jgi:hypothetical protein
LHQAYQFDFLTVDGLTQYITKSALFLVSRYRSLGRRIQIPAPGAGCSTGDSQSDRLSCKWRGSKLAKVFSESLIAGFPEKNAFRNCGIYNMLRKAAREKTERAGHHDSHIKKSVTVLPRGNTALTDRNAPVAATKNMKMF